MHPRIDCFTLEPVPVGVCRKREHLRVRVIPKEACLTNSFQNGRTGDLIGVRTEYQICRVDVTSGESQEQVPLFVLKAAAELGRTAPRANVIGVQGYDLPTLMFWKHPAILCKNERFTAIRPITKCRFDEYEAVYVFLQDLYM